MPIYQYKCTDCGHRVEALQKMSDPHLTDCPICETPTLKKQLTAAAFKLKGSGWYETDFKNSGKEPATKKSESGSSVGSDAGNKEGKSTARDSVSDNVSESGGPSVEAEAAGSKSKTTSSAKANSPSTASSG